MFVIYVMYPNFKIIIVYLVWKTQIAILVTKKVIVSTQYLNFTNIFSKKSAIKLFKRFAINKYTINLINRK